LDGFDKQRDGITKVHIPSVYFAIFINIG
jgi:hypothetical protein